MKKKTILFSLIVIAGVVILGIFISRALWRTRYKLEYQELIIQYADTYELDRYLVASVIFTESSFRADAVSPRGATGLMQIMPDVGEWIGEKLQIEPYNHDMLLQPEYNIQFGCWLLHTLYEWHGNDETIVLAAYNAGSGNVNKWLQDAQYSSDGITLDKIPFPETEKYVVKVQNAYEKYKMLYKELEQ